MRKEILAASFLAALGCGQDGNAERGTGDVGDVKDIKKVEEKVPADLVDRPSDPDFVVQGEDVGRMTYDVGVKCDSETLNMEHGTDIAVKKEAVEMQEQEFRNVLMEEADSIRPGDWMGDGYEKEVERLKEKLPADIWRNKFNSSPEQLMRFFAARGDQAKRGVICLLEKTEDEDGENHYLINKEYRDKVKALVEKYSAEYGVPVEVIYSVMAVENGGKHDPRKNPADGAYGIMQIQADIVEEMERLYPKEDWSRASVKDLEDNIHMGVAYLKYLHDRFGQWSFALMAYNSGPTIFERRMAGGEEQKSKIRRGKDGWRGWSKDKNLWWACSRHGRAFMENGNAGYAIDAMYEGPLLQQIIESEQDEVVLNWKN